MSTTKCLEHDFPIPTSLETAAFVESLARYALRNQMEVEGRERDGLVLPDVAAGYCKSMKEIHRICEESLKYFDLRHSQNPS